ncbi:hypothetical protein C8J57DRAFT_1300143, partial [Mycena rebaudengoi]
VGGRGRGRDRQASSKRRRPRTPRPPCGRAYGPDAHANSQTKAKSSSLFSPPSARRRDVTVGPLLPGTEAFFLLAASLGAFWRLDSGSQLGAIQASIFLRSPDVHSLVYFSDSTSLGGLLQFCVLVLSTSTNLDRASSFRLDYPHWILRRPT